MDSKFHFIFISFPSNQIKSNQIKSNQIIVSIDISNNNNGKNMLNLPNIYSPWEEELENESWAVSIDSGICNDRGSGSVVA